MTDCPTCGGRDLKIYTIQLEPPKGQKKPTVETGTICWDCRMYHGPSK